MTFQEIQNTFSHLDFQEECLAYSWKAQESEEALTLIREKMSEVKEKRLALFDLLDDTINTGRE